MKLSVLIRPNLKKVKKLSKTMKLNSMAEKEATNVKAGEPAGVDICLRFVQSVRRPLLMSVSLCT